MILVGHQPEYLPYIGFFSKTAQADAFMFVDHVQFLKKSFQNRNKIRIGPGSSNWIWLTVPVITRERRFQKINEVEIDNSSNWGEKHWKTIYLNYKKAPFFNVYKNFFEQVYSTKWNLLIDLNEYIICYVFEKIGIKIPVYKSSNYNFNGAKTDLLIEMCEKLGADTYLSGIGAKNSGYVEEDKFLKHGLNHVYTRFNHPSYPQCFKPFVTSMSIIDLLFNCGKDSLDIIRSSYEN